MDYLEASSLVFTEFVHSVRKHSDWHDYTIEQMMAVIIQELLMEAGDAEARGDIHGEHGVIRELTQVASCCIKAIMVLSDRPEGRLAETLQPAGLHSEVEECDLPASPSLHQEKESCSNHPNEVMA